MWVVLYPGTEMTEERVRTIRIPRASLKEIKKERLRKELGLLGDVAQNHAAGHGEATGTEDSAGGGKGRGEPVAPPSAVEVILQGIEETWVHIAVDREPGYEKTLKAGDRYSCRAKERVKLRIGNGTGVRVFYDGRVYENLGKRGDVVNISFPPSGDG
jgi:hypothetical protein